MSNISGGFKKLILKIIGLSTLGVFIILFAFWGLFEILNNIF